MFGILQGFQLGTILVVGVIVSFILLRMIPIDGQPMNATLNRLFPITLFPWLPATLWGIEFLLYFGITWMIAAEALPALIGGVLGLIIRLLVSMGFSLVLSIKDHLSFSDVLADVQGASWAYRALAIVIACIALNWPFYSLFAEGFSTKKATSPGKTVDRPKQFAFDTAKINRPSSATGGYPSRTIVKDELAPTTRQLTPPQEFVMPKPIDSVHGTVNIPLKVLVESIPDLEHLLAPETVAKIRLAFIVPQLSHGTIWLTWAQVFGDTLKNTHGRLDEEMQDRWLRLRPKHYVLQVPAELFTVHRVPPPWMRLAEVPQEQQFTVEV